MIKHCSQALILLAILLLTNTAYSAPMMAILDENNQRVNVGSVGSYYIDETGSLTLRDLDSEQLRKRFIPLKGDFLQFGLTKGNVWIQVDIAPKLQPGQSALLHIKAPRAQEVDVYTHNLPNSQVFAEMGDARPYQNRPLAYPDYIIPLPVNTTPVYTVYIKVSSRIPISLIIEVKTLSALSNDIQKDSLITGLLMGILLILLASYLFFYLRTLHPMYLIGSFLLLGIAGLHFSLHGLIYQLFPMHTGLQERVYNFFSLSSVALISWFTRYYLDTPVNLPRANKLLFFVIVCNLALAFIYTLAPQELSIALLSASAASTLLILQGVALYGVCLKIPYSQFYLVARLVLLVGYSLWALAIYGILSLPFWYEWGLTIAITLEALVHFAGMIARHTPMRTNTMKVDDSYQEELLSELASKLKRQTNIIDHQYSLQEPSNEQLKRAYKNLSNLAERISIIQNLHNPQTNSSNRPANLQLLIDEATLNFYALDQTDAEIEMQYKGTLNWELLSHSRTIKHIYQAVMEELKHHTDQTLHINSAVEANDRDGQRQLIIRAYPIPSSISLESEHYFGPRYLQELVEKLEGTLSLTGDGRGRSLTCQIPVNARPVEASELARLTQSEDITMLLIGHQDSELLERTGNFLLSRLFSTSHIDKVEELHQRLIDRTEHERFVILLFEDQQNFGASELAGFASFLHERDSCFLISNNVNMSQDYASALGFDGFVYSAQIETKLLPDIERAQRVTHTVLPRIKRTL
ncbi:7TMR-DISM family protein [Marinomonas gallaica]|uniref:7TMR-DISM family protein n=1 Tax=Marinomonas gallaica TaxID=1806667 RepID=UPI003CE5B246